MDSPTVPSPVPSPVPAALPLRVPEDEALSWPATMGAASFGFTNTQPLTVSDILARVRERWLLFLTPVVLAVVAAVGYTLTAPAIYVSTASVVVQPLLAEQFGNVNLSSVINMSTEAQVARSSAVATAAGERLGLSADVVRESFTVDSPQDTEVLNIHFSSGTPDGAAAGAQTVAEAYLAYREGSAQSDAERRLTSITDQIDAVNLKLADGGQASAYQETLRSLLTDQRELTSIKATSGGRVITRAVPPLNQSSPRPVVDVAIGTAGGLIVGLIASVMLPRRRPRVTVAAVPREQPLPAGAWAQLPEPEVIAPRTVREPVESGSGTAPLGHSPVVTRQATANPDDPAEGSPGAAAEDEVAAQAISGDRDPVDGAADAPAGPAGDSVEGPVDDAARGAAGLPADDDLEGQGAERTDATIEPADDLDEAPGERTDVPDGGTTTPEDAAEPSSDPAASTEEPATDELIADDPAGDSATADAATEDPATADSATADSATEDRIPGAPGPAPTRPAPAPSPRPVPGPPRTGSDAGSQRAGGIPAPSGGRDARSDIARHQVSGGAPGSGTIRNLGTADPAATAYPTRRSMRQPGTTPGKAWFQN